ncbi:MAG: hypothetical protein SGPRY_014640 [Prymnesium sp.]
MSRTCTGVIADTSPESSPPADPPFVNDMERLLWESTQRIISLRHTSVEQDNAIKRSPPMTAPNVKRHSMTTGSLDLVGSCSSKGFKRVLKAIALATGSITHLPHLSTPNAGGFPSLRNTHDVEATPSVESDIGSARGNFLVDRPTTLSDVHIERQLTAGTQHFLDIRVNIVRPDVQVNSSGKEHQVAGSQQEIRHSASPNSCKMFHPRSVW